MTDLLVYYPGICVPVVHPYDVSGPIPVSSVAEFSWNVLSSVVSQEDIEWNIVAQRINSQAAVTWNTAYRVHDLLLGPSPGLCSPVTHPLDWRYNAPAISWNTAQRNSASAKIRWNILSRIVSSKIIRWNIRVKEYAFAHFNWNVLKRLHVPGIAARYYNGLMQPVVHPIDSPNLVVTPNVTWNVVQRTHSSANIRWNTRDSVISQKRILWNTKCLSVTKTAQITWNTRKLVYKDAAITWNMSLRIPKKARITWNTRSAITSTKAVKWNTRKAVTETAIVKWNTVSRITKSEGIRWNTLTRDRLSKALITWNTLKRISIPDYQTTFYNTIIQPVMHPISYRQNSYGPNITWNTGVNRISSTAQINWNTRTKVEKQATIRWNTSLRIPVQAAIMWNTKTAVSSQAIIEWNVGKVMPMYIRQTSVSRQDFAY